MSQPQHAALTAEHERIRRALRVRSSTFHFAQGAIAIFVSFVLGGTAARLWWEYAGAQYLWLVVATVTGASGALLYAVVRMVLGKRDLRVELGELARLMSVRQALRLDDPEAQLPR